MADAETKTTAKWPGWLIATAICIRFYSRLPIPRLAGETELHAAPDFRGVPRALPLAALVIALPGALVLLGAGLAGVAPALAATLAVTVLVATTGAFHEDGLADSADGLFGGHTSERRLEIMKDSRIGSYGACALGLSLMLRVTALASILQAAGAWAAAGSVLVAAPWSRMQGVRLLANEPSARNDGAAAAVGTPTAETVMIGLCLAAAIALAITGLTRLPLAGLALGGVLALLACAALARLSRRLIGGQTGDILGAAQQIGEIAVYLGLALVLGRGAA